MAQNGGLTLNLCLPFVIPLSCSNWNHILIIKSISLTNLKALQLVCRGPSRSNLLYSKTSKSFGEKSYFLEAKSLVYTFNCAGESIAEVEVIECLVNGLVNSLNGFFQYYYLMHSWLSFDLLYNSLLNQEQLLKLVSCISFAHLIANNPCPPLQLQGQDENEIECFIEKAVFNQSVQLAEDDLTKVFFF